MVIVVAIAEKKKTFDTFCYVTWDTGFVVEHPKKFTKLEMYRQIIDIGLHRIKRIS